MTLLGEVLALPDGPEKAAWMDACFKALRTVFEEVALLHKVSLWLYDNDPFAGNRPCWD